MKARISQLLTAGFTNSELSIMAAERRSMILRRGYEKVIGEQIIKEVVSENLASLRDEIIRCYETIHPVPIVIKIIEGNDTRFLLDVLYDSDNLLSYYELIIAENKGPDVRMLETANDELAKPLHEESKRRFLKSTGFTSLEEYEEFIRKIEKRIKKDYGENISLEKRMDFINKAIYERKVARFGTAIQNIIFLEDPNSLLDENTRIMCRIIGRDANMVNNASKYYLELHKIPQNSVTIITNTKRDGNTISFLP